MDSRQRRDGAVVEELGWYNPIASNKAENYKLDEGRIMYWLGVGAQPSDIAHKLMKRAGISFKWHLMKQGLDDSAIEKEIQKLNLRRGAQAKEKLEAAEKKAKKKTKKEAKVDETVDEAIATAAVTEKAATDAEPEEVTPTEKEKVDGTKTKTKAKVKKTADTVDKEEKSTELAKELSEEKSVSEKGAEGAEKSSDKKGEQEEQSKAVESKAKNLKKDSTSSAKKAESKDAAKDE